MQWLYLTTLQTNANQSCINITNATSEFGWGLGGGSLITYRQNNNTVFVQPDICFFAVGLILEGWGESATTQ